MSVFSGLRDKARQLFGKAGEGIGEHTDVIPRGRLDDLVFDNVRSESNGLDRMATALGKEFDYTRDLMGDLFTACLSGTKPDVRLMAEMRPSHRPHVAIEKELIGTKEFDKLRTVTAGDEYDSALAVMSMRDQLTGALRKTAEAREKAKEAQARKDEANAERNQCQQREQTAGEAQEQADRLAALAEQAQQAAQAAQDAADADPSDAGLQQGAAAAAAQAQAATDQAGGAAVAAEVAVSSFAEALAAAEAALAQSQADSSRAEALAGSAMADMRKELAAAAEQATKERDDEHKLIEAFGISPGDLQRMSFNERYELAQRLAGSRLAKFADLIGGFRLMESAERRRKTQHGHSEVHGIELDNDLGRLLANEIVSMATPELEDDFWKRFTQHQLMCFRLRGSEKVGKGSVVAVVDESGSMASTDMADGASREAYSKAMCLAMLDRARAQQRDFVYIGFSSPGEQRVLRFPKGQATLPEILEMTEHFYNGGTEFQTPLLMAQKIIDTDYTDHGLPKADVVFMTDGQAPVSPDFVEGWNALRAKAGFRCWGIAVSSEAGLGTVQLVSDTTRRVDHLTSRARDVADMFQAL